MTRQHRNRDGGPRFSATSPSDGNNIRRYPKGAKKSRVGLPKQHGFDRTISRMLPSQQ